MESVSLNLDFEANEEEDDIEDRQKEIQGLLSTAFDDFSSLSEDEEEESHEFKKFTTNGYNGNDKNDGNNQHKYTNGLTSTPLQRLQNEAIDKYKIDFWSKTNGKHLNISDILENEAEDDLISLNSANCDQQNGNQLSDENHLSLSLKNVKISGHSRDKNSSVENKRSESKQDFETNEKSMNERHLHLLIEENQRLSNELIVSQQKFLTINGNYESLHYKLKELDEINTQKENQLVKLEAKIRSLELNIKVEKETKEEVQRKLAVSESTIESLQYQLREIGKSDCLVRAQETHESVVNCLKSKYENQLILLKGEIEGLRHELNSKNSEINEITKELQQKKNENTFKEQLKDMINVCKDMWEQEMKEKVENDMKSLIESHEQMWSKKAEKRLIDERNKWEQHLQTEISQLLEFLKMKARVSSSELPQYINLKFVPLTNLWRALEESYDSKEKALEMQIRKLKEAKEELEEALNESRHSKSSSPYRCPTNEQIFHDLKTELQKVNEEAVLMKEKLNKYKQHYHRLIKKHDNEIQRIKEEFADILQTLKPQLK